MGDKACPWMEKDFSGQSGPTLLESSINDGIRKRTSGNDLETLINGGEVNVTDSRSAKKQKSGEMDASTHGNREHLLIRLDDPCRGFLLGFHQNFDSPILYQERGTDLPDPVSLDLIPRQDYLSITPQCVAKFSREKKILIPATLGEMIGFYKHALSEVPVTDGSVPGPSIYMRIKCEEQLAWWTYEQTAEGWIPKTLFSKGDGSWSELSPAQFEARSLSASKKWRQSFKVLAFVKVSKVNTLTCATAEQFMGYMFRLLGRQGARAPETAGRKPLPPREPKAPKVVMLGASLFGASTVATPAAGPVSPAAAAAANTAATQPPPSNLSADALAFIQKLALHKNDVRQELSPPMVHSPTKTMPEIGRVVVETGISSSIPDLREPLAAHLRSLPSGSVNTREAASKLMALPRTTLAPAPKPGPPPPPKTPIQPMPEPTRVLSCIPNILAPAELQAFHVIANSVPMESVPKAPGVLNYIPSILAPAELQAIHVIVNSVRSTNLSAAVLGIMTHVSCTYGDMKHNPLAAFMPLTTASPASTPTLAAPLQRPQPPKLQPQKSQPPKSQPSKLQPPKPAAGAKSSQGPDPATNAPVVALAVAAS